MLKAFATVASDEIPMIRWLAMGRELSWPNGKRHCFSSRVPFLRIVPQIGHVGATPGLCRIAGVKIFGRCPTQHGSG